VKIKVDSINKKIIIEDIDFNLVTAKASEIVYLDAIIKLTSRTYLELQQLLMSQWHD